tara:strand:+ start:649 stop:1452 length:804 start_codon:yes stop_codon:yes gene_type:complete
MDYEITSGTKTYDPQIVVYCSGEEDRADATVDSRDKVNDAGIGKNASNEFLSWWSVVGSALLDSVHHNDKSVRRNAVLLMMPITHKFPRTEVMQMTVTTPEIKRLHELYASKIVIEQRHMENITNQWCDKIDQLCRACRQEEERIRLTKGELLKKAEDLVAKYGSDVSDIVGEQLTRRVERLDREKDLRVQIARLQAHSQQYLDTDLKSCHLDADILKIERDLVERFPPETFGSIRQMYLSHIRNIEHQIAEDIQERCKTNWLGGLS